MMLATETEAAAPVALIPTELPTPLRPPVSPPCFAVTLMLPVSVIFEALTSPFFEVWVMVPVVS